MSNARSPREVCSTTIGTSGLMVLASFASSAGFLPNVATAVRVAPAVRRAVSCRASRAGPTPLLGALACSGVHSFSRALRLLDADRLGLATSSSTAWRVGDVLAQPRRAGRSSAAARAASRAGRLLALGRRARAPRAARSSVGSICSASTTAASTASRRSALRGLGLGLVGQRLLVLAGDLQVGLLARCPGAASADSVCSSSSCARAWTSWSGSSIWASATAASSTACSNSRSIALLLGLGERARGCPRAARRACRSRPPRRRTRRRARAAAWP